MERTWTMATSPERTPKYRHYRPKDLGVVRIDGRDHYLGKFNTPESYEKYHRLLAERYAQGPGTPAASQQARPEADNLTIDELCLGYYRHAAKYYRKGGKPTIQVRLIRLSLKVLRRLYAHTLAKDFGPLALGAWPGRVREGRALPPRVQPANQPDQRGVQVGRVPTVGLRGGLAQSPGRGWAP
jgi:hypothetical protein